MVRFKNRYLLFEMVWKDGRVDDSLTDANVASAIRDSVGINFGDVGFSRALGSFQGEQPSRTYITAFNRSVDGFSQKNVQASSH